MMDARNRSQRSFAVVCATAGVMLGAAPAVGKDLEALARFVAPAYTAMNFAAVCARNDPEFLARTAGPRGSAMQYAEHVKDEAIESLSHDEAVAALTMAANSARSKARETFRQFNSADPVVESNQIRAWCESDGRAFVQTFIQDHDGRHQALMEMKQSQR